MSNLIANGSDLIPATLGAARGVDIYRAGHAFAHIRRCPAHGQWSFPATPDGTVAASAWALDHADCQPPQKPAQRPPNKSRRPA